MFPHLIKELAKQAHSIGWKGGVGHDAGNFSEGFLDVVPVFVFVGVQFIEMVVIHKIGENAGVEVIGLRNGQIRFQLRIPFRESRQDDPVGQQ